MLLVSCVLVVIVCVRVGAIACALWCRGASLMVLSVPPTSLLFGLVVVMASVSVLCVLLGRSCFDCVNVVMECGHCCVCDVIVGLC